MAVLIVIAIPVLVLYLILHRGTQSVLGDHRPDIVRKHNMTPMGAHLLGYPPKKRRR